MIRTLKNTKYFFRYYKKRILFLTLFLILLCGVSISFAVDESNALYRLICTMIDDIVSTRTIQEVEELVQIGFNETSLTLGGYTINNMGTVMSAVNDAMQIYGLVFCSALFFVGLMNAYLTQQAYEEILLKRLIVWIITIGLIAWSMMLCLDIANIGSGIATKISSIANMTYDSQNEIIEALKLSILEECSSAEDVSSWAKKIGAWMSDQLGLLGYVLQLFIPWIAMKAVQIIIKVTCWGRAFEILILSALSPVAFCDISSGQGSGMGSIGRFVKNFAAISIQGAIIVLIMFFCSQVHLAIIASNSDAVAFFNNTWNICVIGFVEVGLCTKSQGMARQLLGIN